MKLVEGLLPQPDMRPVLIEGYEKKDEFYQLQGDPYEYMWTGDDKRQYKIVVDPWTITDGGSRPKIASLAGIRRDGVARPAYLVHDEIFRKGGKGVKVYLWDREMKVWELIKVEITFTQANRLFCRMLRECGIPRRRRRVMFRAVDSIFGRKHFGRKCPALS